MESLFNYGSEEENDDTQENVIICVMYYLFGIKDYALVFTKCFVCYFYVVIRLDPIFH